VMPHHALHPTHPTPYISTRRVLAPEASTLLSLIHEHIFTHAIVGNTTAITACVVLWVNCNSVSDL
ncbi:MAG: hypothetical protein ACP5EP_13215, partial [Acidobacteriaceae bacterium]